MKGEASDHHVNDMRLPYMEGLLSPEERTDFESHVQRCPECASKLEEMSQWVSVVKDNARALCPDGWELLDYAQKGKDPRGIISRHLEQCDSCSDDVESFRISAVKQGVPADLWVKMKRLSVGASAVRGTESRLQWVREMLETVVDLFRPAVLVPAAVAVVVLIVALSYHMTPVPRMVALSSVTWGAGTSDLNLMGGDRSATLPADTEKKRLATVLLLTNFKHPLDQDSVDYLYRALEPPSRISERYQIVSPEEFKHVAGQDLLGAADDKALASTMRAKLKIAELLIIELVKEDGRFGIRARLLDTATGSTTRQHDWGKLNQSELVPVMEKATLSLVDPRGAGS